MVLRRRPEDLRDPSQLLAAMGECREAALRAKNEIQPFCLTYRVLDVLTSTIDMVGWFFTGSSSHFHLMQMPHPKDMEPGT